MSAEIDEYPPLRVFKILGKNQSVTDGQKDGRETIPHHKQSLWGYKHRSQRKILITQILDTKLKNNQLHIQPISIQSKWVWHFTVKMFAYMWTLPDLQGGSLKWALKFLLKRNTFYNNFKSLSYELRIFLYILYIFHKPPWNERKISLMPFETYHMYACVNYLIYITKNYCCL